MKKTKGFACTTKECVKNWTCKSSVLQLIINVGVFYFIFLLSAAFFVKEIIIEVIRLCFVNYELSTSLLCVCYLLCFLLVQNEIEERIVRIKKGAFLVRHDVVLKVFYQDVNFFCWDPRIINTRIYNSPLLSLISGSCSTATDPVLVGEGVIKKLKYNLKVDIAEKQRCYVFFIKSKKDRKSFLLNGQYKFSEEARKRIEDFNNPFDNEQREKFYEFAKNFWDQYLQSSGIELTQADFDPVFITTEDLLRLKESNSF